MQGFFCTHPTDANAAIDDKLQPVLHAIRAETHCNVNPSTPWRWITKGIAGLDGERIKLQVWYVGRSPHTKRSAVRQWLESVTQARMARMARTQQRADDVTDDEFEAVGLTGPR